MLRQDEFTEVIVEEIRDRLPDSYSVTTKEVVKQNDAAYTAINVTKEGNDIGVVLYVEDLFMSYQQGQTTEVIADKTVRAIRENEPEIGSAPIIDREFVMDHVYFRMANAGMNQKRLENIATCPAPGAEDIALYPCVDVSVGKRRGVTMISRTHMESLGITEEELHSAARANTERRIEVIPLKQVLQEMMPAFMADELDSPFYVTRDKGAVDGVGSASIFGAPEALKKMEGDYYIIPSSVHEVLLLPKSFEPDTDRLHELVHEVNRDVLQPEDFLSDHVYESNSGNVSTLKSELDLDKGRDL